MKIIFICGSLEPGQDGVGDYVRRLAAELILKQNEVSIIALYDKNVKRLRGEMQYDNGIQIPILRLPSDLSFKRKVTIAKDWIDAFAPEWISLQYVPFSFHPKGLPFGLSSFLESVGKNRKWHIMFHELWLVSKSSLPTKEVLIGNLQKILIGQLVQTLNPEIIHTQTQFSQYQLKKLGLTAHLLPLFSNIPVVSRATPDVTENKEMRIVSFGSIHPNALIEKFANEAAHYCKKTDREIILTIIGRAGTHQNEWIAVWEKAGLKAELLGELPPEKVSKVLSTSFKGLTSTPFVMSEKSGSVAAMREHNVPVICIADPYHPSGFNFHPPEGILEYSRNGFENCITYKSTFQYSYNVSVIALMFLNELLAIA